MKTRHTTQACPWSGVRRASLLLSLAALLLGVLPIIPLAATQDEALPAPPYQCGIGCYGSDAGPNVLSRTGLGDFHYSPTVVHAGETITGHIDPVVQFGINVLMTWPSAAPGQLIGAKSVPQGSASNYPSYAGSPDVSPAPDAQVCGGGASTRTVVTCTWKATAATGAHWAVTTATIGNPPARGVTQAYYAVLAHDYGISGRVTLSNGQPMPGVPISLGGSRTAQAVTDSGGAYAFQVPEGTYTVGAGGGVCVQPQSGNDCATSKKVTVPSSQTIDFKAAQDGTIDGTILDSQSKPVAGVSVHIVGPSGQVVTTGNDGSYSARVAKGTYYVAATQQVKDKSGATKNRAFCAARTGGGSGCTSIVRVDVPPDTTVDFTPADDAGMLVALRSTGSSNGVLRLTATITNPRDDPITDLVFDTASGIKVETVPPANAAPGAASGPVVQLVEGPAPALPTFLGRGASITLNYGFVAVAIGKATLTTKITGKLPDFTAVNGLHSGTATVTDRAVTQADFDQVGIGGIENALAAAGDGVKQIDDLTARDVLATLKVQQPGEAELRAGQELRLPDKIAGMVRQTVAQQKDFWSTYGDNFFGTLNQSGKEGGQMLADLYDVVTDPVARRDAAEKLWDMAKTLPASAKQNLGYLGTAIGASLTPEGLDNEVAAGKNLLTGVGNAISDAKVGYEELAAAARAKARDDPIGARRDVAAAWGKGSATVAKEVGVGVAGEGLTRGLIKAGSTVLGPVVRNLSVADDAAGAVQGVDAAAVSGGGASSDAARRLALGQKALETVQELPYGTVLDQATLTARGGIVTSDADQIAGIIKDAEAKFPGLATAGGGLEIVARTSEPLSAGIDGVAKREIMKPKALSSIGQLMGGEESLAGQVSVFNPTELTDAELRGLEARNPGFTAKYRQRLSDAKTSWAEWSDSAQWAKAPPGSADHAKYQQSLRFLVDASAKYADGITPIVARPGNPVPYGLRYIEQLDEPAFQSAKGLSADAAAALKNQLSGVQASGNVAGAHPGILPKTKIGTRTVKGTTAFVEELHGGKPFVSDLDLQAVRPKNGWPAGVNRGEVEAYVMSRLKALNRFPFHAWSDAAIDLPSDYLEAAAKFELSTANPAVAEAAATDIARRFQSMANIADRKAAALEAQAAAAGGNAQTVLRQQAKALRDKSAKFKQLTDPKALLKKWPPGEKAVVFTAGGVTVGSGTGGR